MSTFKTRLITGIFIVAVYAIMYFLGATAVTAFTTLMMLFAIVELRNAFRNIDVKINYVPIMIAVFLKAALSYVIKTFESTSFLIPFEQLIFAILVLTLFITYIFDLTEKRLLNFGMSLMTGLYRDFFLELHERESPLFSRDFRNNNRCGCVCIFGRLALWKEEALSESFAEKNCGRSSLWTFGSDWTWTYSDSFSFSKCKNRHKVNRSAFDTWNFS